MDYREDIKKCYLSIMEQEKVAVNMHISSGFAINIAPITQTLDNLKIMMVYAWEKLGYGTYHDFFHGEELPSKYKSILGYPHETIVGDFKKYFRLFHVRTIFDDDIASLDKMEEIINALG